MLDWIILAAAYFKYRGFAFSQKFVFIVKLVAMVDLQQWALHLLRLGK